jgi:hypothetical protein
MTTLTNRGSFFAEMLRVWDLQPAVGVRDLRHLDMPRVLWQASWPRRPPVLRALRQHGQVEGRRAGEDEGGCFNCHTLTHNLIALEIS